MPRHQPVFARCLRSRAVRTRPLRLVGLVLLLGCSGSISDVGPTPGREGPSPSNPGGGSFVPGAPQPTCNETTVGRSPLQRLTRTQYDAAVSALLGTPVSASREFPADVNIEGFDVAYRASQIQVEQYDTAAERVTSELDPARIGFECTDGDGACVDAFLRSFARRAYRRPSTTDELTDLRATFDAGALEGGALGGLRLVVRAILQAPSFLYHLEVPTTSEPGVHPLDDFALASRLSFFLWAGPPDDALLDAAERGDLRDPERYRLEVARLLDHERALDGARALYRQWFGIRNFENLEKNPDFYPAFGADVARDLQRSLELFLDEQFETGDLRTMLTSNVAFVNARIAPIFRLRAEDFGDDFRRVELTDGTRAGLVTHPALMALLGKSNQSDPIHRAVFVRKSLLCQTLPTPPANLTITAPDPAPGLSTRQRFAEHSSREECAVCHALLDGVGFGFEHYDGIGEWRADDEGVPVDASGEMVGTLDIDGPFDGAIELADKLAGSVEVAGCAVQQVFRIALRRKDAAADVCSLYAIETEFREGGQSLRALMFSVATSDAFRLQEVLP